MGYHLCKIYCCEGIMQIKAQIDDRYKQIELHVCNHTADEEVMQLLKELHTLFDDSLIGTDEKGNRCLLKPKELLTIYAEGQRVYGLTVNGRHTIGKTLYELEEALKGAGFIRISKSELINFRAIKSLDLSITGTIKVVMQNGYETYCSRRNVAKIKELLVREKG